MKHFVFLIFTGFSAAMFGQVKSLTSKDTVDLTFSGTKINPYSQEYDSTGKWTLSGYIDTYISHYSDTVNSNGFVKFPTIAPRNNQFGLNIIQLSAKYQAKSFRATTTLFTGDCPKAAWSSDFNAIQEANLGFKLCRKLWLDMGFFRTHIGLESIQPRENMTLSLATTTYFEPYFLSGAKITLEVSPKWTLQAHAFNSFNQFIETNNNKALGISAAYTADKAYLVFSSLWSNETNNPSSWRLYNNLCFSYRTNKLIFGAEANMGIQQNGMGNQYVTSALLAAKYRITHKIANYLRGECFIDPHEVLTGPVYNENHNLVGMEIAGITHGWEYKPIPNSYVRLEGRVLSNYYQHLFSYANNPSKIRTEITLGMAVWF